MEGKELREFLDWCYARTPLDKKKSNLFLELDELERIATEYESNKHYI
jgi:hypothetical protein